MWAGLANGSISFGDVISKAAGKFVGDLFNGSPTMRDLGRAVQDAARQSQAANPGRRTHARVVPNVPPPRQAPRPPPRQPPHAGSQQGWQSQWGSPPGSQQQQQRRPPPPGPDPRAEACRILGLDPRSQHTEQTIAARRKSLAKTWHPDRPGGNESMMKKINAAADLLIAQLGKPGR